MKEFIAKYQDRIAGVLSGWDRLVLRGSLRRISYVWGMMGYLWAQQVRLSELGRHAQQVSERLKAASLAEALGQGRPVQYLTSSRVSKEGIARGIAARDGVREGLVCVLTCVEPCQTYEVYRNRETKQLELVSRKRKCLFLYHYWNHPELGFVGGRIQTWFPFPIQICLNGREWLMRQLAQAGRPYRSWDNCVVWVEDFEGAQQLLEAQQRVRWPEMLRGIARQLNPLHEQMFAPLPMDYYWSVYQSEWATDVVFRERAELGRLYERWLRHGMATFRSVEVMRFLGRKVTAHGCIPGGFQGEVVSDVKRRVEGVRLRHRVGQNSIKMYDKAYTGQGSVLRIETTLGQTGDFRVWRRAEGQRGGGKQWRRLRKGIADLGRRGEVCQKANERYAAALAAVDDGRTVQECAAVLERPVYRHQKRYRALHPFGQDAMLLEAIHRGEFLLNGLRNRDLQGLLFPTPAPTLAERRRRSAAVSRKLALLRAHGLLRKVPRTHRYHLTERARKLLALLLEARHVTANVLAPKAA